MIFSDSVKLSPDTVYHHVTHWKAGSQWFLAVLKAAFNDAVVKPQPGMKHVYAPPEVGKVYPCCYITQREYLMLPLAPNARRVVLIRDLRDTLTSAYFSIRQSHESNMFVDKWRPVLQRVSPEDGLMYLMEVWLFHSAMIQRTWLSAGEPVVRLEDFMKRPAETLHHVFSGAWGLKTSMAQAEKLMRDNSFARLSGGRQPGEEDISAHYRKGVQGDWKKHFTPRAVEHFKALYSDVLVLSGYEKSRDW